MFAASSAVLARIGAHRMVDRSKIAMARGEWRFEFDRKKSDPRGRVMPYAGGVLDDGSSRASSRSHLLAAPPPPSQTRGGAVLGSLVVPASSGNGDAICSRFIEERA
jgi:hypothetical protein